MSLNEILTYDLSDQSPVFDGRFRVKPDKHSLVSAFEKLLSRIDHKFIKNCNQKKTHLKNSFVDFMSQL